ncbi:glycosyl hydrolase-related protein [Bacillus sp. JJ1122]|uniref:glycoside hydrolase family 38 N-terminal domain-containing protein n=1 Tax=Bacillus sp. JJ1122 TaxID=3122951 RepID=UPI002FFDA211
MNKEKFVYVVPHSHWDREWYFTIEDSNVLLAENLDHLMTILENDQDYHGYVFDAQVSVIEEYLKINPEEKDRIKKLVSAKRLFIGPWYTQTDTLLVNKESTIRNLLYGTRIAREFGHSMEVGYLPDIFGQNAYLPSIFSGFGIDSSILQRGIYTDQLAGDLNFIWKSPDGKTVKANNLYFGYGPGKFLAADEAYYEERLQPMLGKLADLNENSDHLLLPAGGDQVLVREHFPETIAKLNEKDPVHEYVLSDYESFMKAAWENGNFKNVIEGELIAPQKSRIHNTIRSQRYDIKQLNDQVEEKIIHILEPMAMIGVSLGLNYPEKWLDQMWKQLFDVHAHDSIGGCNSDDTNADIMHRLTKVDRIADGLLNILKKQLTRAISNQLEKNNLNIVFNTLPKPYSGMVESVLFTKEKEFAVTDLDGIELSFDLTSQEYISGGKIIVVTAEGEKEVEQPGYYRNVVLIHADKIPAMGYKALLIEEGRQGGAEMTASSDAYIENDLYLVRLEDGKLELSNKKSGKALADFMKFENMADAGDSYDFSPLDGDVKRILDEAVLISVEKADQAEIMTVMHEAHVLGNLDERQSGTETMLLQILTKLELRKGEKTLRIVHEIDNRICDHRVRVLLDTPVESPESSYGDQAFSVLERPTVNAYLSDWKEKGFAEAPVPYYPLENFAAVADGEGTFAVITKGIKEYEVIKKSGTFALTLFRSVGLLGRDNLAWRPGRASGINNKVVLTPDAQMLQKMEFHYGIVFVDEPFEAGKLFAEVDQYRGRYASYQLQAYNTFEERLERFELPQPVEKALASYSLFEIDNERVFVSACKKAYEDGNLLVRLYNPSGDKESFAVTSSYFTRAVETDLYEKEGEELDMESIVIPPKGYITLKLMKGGINHE